MTRLTMVLTHSTPPATNPIWTIRAAQGRQMIKIAGIVRVARTKGNWPARKI
jgi:hypothetical protein